MCAWEDWRSLPWRKSYLCGHYSETSYLYLFGILEKRMSCLLELPELLLSKEIIWREAFILCDWGPLLNTRALTYQFPISSCVYSSPVLMYVNLRGVRPVLIVSLSECNWGVIQGFIFWLTYVKIRALTLRTDAKPCSIKFNPMIWVYTVCKLIRGKYASTRGLHLCWSQGCCDYIKYMRAKT